MMMRMLAGGGLSVVEDGQRPPDDNNPHGYFEDARTRSLAEDAGWLRSARGRAVKVIHSLLRFVPPDLPCRIILMTRDPEEVLQSQGTMLQRLGASQGAMPQGSRGLGLLDREVEAVRNWLFEQRHLRFIEVPYARVLDSPRRAAIDVARLLGGGLDLDAMTDAVDPALYRSRPGGVIPS